MREIGYRLNGVDPDDGQLGIVDVHGELVGHVIAVGIDDDSLAGNLDRVLARIGARCRSLNAGNVEGLTIDLELQGLETGYGLLGAVVGHGLGIGSEGNLVLLATVGNGQGSIRLVDLIVVQIGSLVGDAFERILGGADDLLRAGERIGGTLAIDPTSIPGSLPNGDLVIGQGLAVVLLGTTRGGQGDRTLFDRQFTFVLHDVVVFGNRRVERYTNRIFRYATIGLRTYKLYFHMVNNNRVFVGYASFECNYLSNKSYLLLFSTTKPDSASFEPGTHPIKITKHPRPQPRPASHVPVHLGESMPKAALDHGLRPHLRDRAMRTTRSLARYMPSAKTTLWTSSTHSGMGQTSRNSAVLLLKARPPQ
ncbi:hypothetical protein ACTQX9_07655 [Collinsella sp. LCP19S3_F2]|uniref:hypothetical protein n=1 Tax=Collinsella sp. LCP19S3_F2 TaxID=3438765 RepID=UPI003F8FCF37